MGMVKNGWYHQSKLFVNKHVFYVYKAQIIAEKKREKTHRADVGFINWGHPLLIVGGHHSWGYALWASESLIFMQQVVRN